jgi:ketosteroid isomerase-like protein
MTRSPQQAFADHIAAVNQHDIEAILQDYADDAVVLTAQGALEGREGVRAVFTQAFAALPDPTITATRTVFGNDALLVWWTAESVAGRISDGVDTFQFTDGLIALHSLAFTIEITEGGQTTRR